MPAILIGLHALFKFPRRKKVSQGLAGWNPLHRLIAGNAMAHDLCFAGKKPPGGIHFPLAGIVPVNLQRRFDHRHSGHPLIQNFVDVRVLQKGRHICRFSGQCFVDCTAQQLPVRRFGLIAHPFVVDLSMGFWILHNRVSVLNADGVTEPPRHPCVEPVCLFRRDLPSHS